MDETMSPMDETIFSVDDTIFLVDETIFFVDEKRARTITAGWGRIFLFYFIFSAQPYEIRTITGGGTVWFLKRPVRFCTLSFLGSQNSTVECASPNLH
jgi:hypothetical protein